MLAFRFDISEKTGKGNSVVFYIISRLQGDKVREAFLTETVELLMAEGALHSILICLPFRPEKNLQESDPKFVQEKPSDVKYLVIDELSMARQAQLEWFKRWLGQATISIDRFGGLMITL